MKRLGYVAEVWQSPPGCWNFRLLANGVTMIPNLSPRTYPSREAAIEAARDAARAHRDRDRGTERVPLDLDD